MQPCHAVDGRFGDAEAGFYRAYEVINSMGVNAGGRSLGAVLVDEKIKVWKGEPFERAMANYYLGLVYYMRHEYDNARGAFENALFKLRDFSGDDDKKGREVESDFAPMTGMKLPLSQMATSLLCRRRDGWPVPGAGQSRGRHV